MIKKSQHQFFHHEPHITNLNFGFFLLRIRRFIDEIRHFFAPSIAKGSMNEQKTAEDRDQDLTIKRKNQKFRLLRYLCDIFNFSRRVIKRSKLMRIPPSPPIPPGNPHSNGPSLVTDLKQLWDNWWNNPSKETAEKLLDFLKTNEQALTKLGNSKKSPFPPSSGNFSDYLKDATDNLSRWVDHGCNPDQKTPVSEWMNDIYIWVNR